MSAVKSPKRPRTGQRNLVRPAQRNGSGLRPALKAVEPERRDGRRPEDLAPAAVFPRLNAAAARQGAADQVRGRRKEKQAPKEQPKGRFQVLDGYRGIGAIAIVVIHAALNGRELFSTTGANAMHAFDLCLPLFFVLSGMVAYLGIVRGAFSGKIRGTRQMLSSRLWRVIPVYWVVILIVWSMRFVGSAMDWSDLFVHLSFMQVWSTHYEFWLDGPSWFLADDIHFLLALALVAPLVAKWSLRFKKNPAKQLGALALLPLAMLAVGMAYIWYISYHGHTAPTTQMLYSPFGRVDEFAIGMLAGMVLCLPGVVKPRPWLANVLTVSGFGVLLFAAYDRWHSHMIWVWYFEIAAVGMGILFAGAVMFTERQVWHRLMSIKPLQLLATVGFTIFLVQEPVMIQLEQWNLIYFGAKSSLWISTVALVVMCALVAWVAYKLVEEPSYRFKKVLDGLRSRQTAFERRRTGPAPRRLPDVVVQLPDGGAVRLRELLGDRPLLVALGAPGDAALAEQRFRLDAGEADVLHVRAEDEAPADSSPREHVVLDPDGALARALNIPAALLEVAPDGHITALHQPRLVLA